MKLPLYVALSIVIPPVATILALADVLRRSDLTGPLRGWWAVVSCIPVFGPFLYIGIGDGALW